MKRDNPVPRFRKAIAFVSILVAMAAPPASLSQTTSKRPVFNKIQMIVQDGENFDQKPVVVTFLDDSILIEPENSLLKKTFNYNEIERAEYSYSKSPRWKTGLGVGAAAFAFPPLFLVAIPLGFTKHRRHWLTLRSESDFVVLKLSKSSRKVFIPTLETKAGITVAAIGEDK